MRGLANGRRRLAALAVLAASLVGVVSATTSGAVNDTCVWAGTAGGNWNTASNWAACDSSFPAAGDIAVFNGTDTDNATVNVAVSVAEIRIESGYTGTITQSGGASITVTAGGAGNGSFNQAAGTFTGAGATGSSITVGGAFSLTGGTFTAPSGGNTVLTVSGNFTKSGAATFNANSGVLRFLGAAATIDVTSLTASTLTLEANDGVAKTVTDGQTINVTGTVNLCNGRLNQASPPAAGTLNHTGALIEQPTACNGFDGGTALLKATQASGTLTFNGQNSVTIGSAPRIEIAQSGTAAVAFTAETFRITEDFTVSSRGSGTFATASSAIAAAPTTGNGLTINPLSDNFNTLIVGDTDGGNDGTVTIQSGEELVLNRNLTLNDGQLAGTVLANGSLTATITQLGTFDGGTGLIKAGGSTGSITFASSGTSVSAGNLPDVEFTRTAGTATSLGSATLRTHNDITVASGALAPTASTSTVVLANSNQLSTGGTLTFNSLNINSTGTVNVASGTVTTTTLTLTDGQLTGSLSATGNVTQASTFDGGTGTLTFSGGAAQTLTGTATTTAGDLPNVVVNKSGGSLTLVTTDAADRIRTSKTWTHTAGTVAAGTSKLVSAGATFAGSSWTLNDLEIRAATTVSVPVLTTGTLTLTSGNVSTGANVLHVTGANPSRTSGHVVGNLRRTVSAVGNVVFDVGTGSDYTPVATDFTAHTAAGTLTATVANADHADIGSSTLDGAQSANRNWTLTADTLRGTYDATFTFINPGDLDTGPTADPTQFVVGKRNGSWSYPTVGTKTATTTQTTGIALSADGASAFQLAEAGATDGAGTASADTTNVSAGQTGRTIVFTYTAAGTMTDGQLRLSVPAGWTAPSNVSGNAGFVTATSASDGSITVEAASGQDIVISGLTLANTNTVTITYGAPPGSGATATSTTGAQTWTIAQRSTAGGTFTNLTAGSPSITVNAADGAGSVTRSPTTIVAGTAGEFTFTYTAPPGGMNSGAVTIAIPSGWSDPQTLSSTGAGYTTATVNGSSVVPGFNSGTRILTVSSVTLAAAQEVVVVYGNDSGDTAPSARAVTPGGASSGTFNFQVQQRSTASGVLTTVSTPTITTTNSADGSGTPGGPASLPRNATGNNVALTYAATTGGMNNGAVEVTVPASWSDPQTGSPGGEGNVTTSTGTPSVSGDVITVTGVSLDSSGNLTINYNNVTTPDQANGAFAFRQRSTSGGALTATAPANVTITLAAAPSVPTTLSPALDAWTNDLTPALTANFTDADTATGSVDFQVCYGADPTCSSPDETFSASGITSGSTGTASPTANLPLGDSYWRARGNDGALTSAYTTPRRIRIEQTVPTQVVSLTAVSNGTATGAASGQGAEAFTDGTTVWYRSADVNGGTFRIRSTVSDAQSGPDQATFTFPADGGGFDFPGTETVSSGDPNYDSSIVTFATGATSVASVTVQGRDIAGNDSSAATLTLAADNAAPTGSITAPGAAAVVKGATVTVSSDSVDTGGSSVRSAEFFFCNGSSCDPFAGTSIGTDTNSAGGWSVTWDTTALLDGDKRLGVRTIDNVGNVFQSVPRLVTVDNTPPTQTLALTNVGTNGGFATAFLSGTTLFYNGNAGAGRTFTVQSTVDGTGSTPFDSEFTLTPGATTFAMAGGNTNTDSTPVDAGPFESPAVTWSATEAGSPTFAVVSRDKAGNASTTATLTLTNDVTAPTGQTIALAGGAAGGFFAGPVGLTLGNGSDGGSALALSTRLVERDTATLTDGVCGAFPGTFADNVTTDVLADNDDDSVVTDNCYRYRFTIRDNVGNQSAAVTVDAQVDTTAPTAAPTLGFSGMTNATASGSTVYVRTAGVTGGFTVTATASDAEAGIRHVQFPATDPSGVTSIDTNPDTSAPYTRAYTWPADSTIAGGPHSVTARNRSDLDSAAATFTITTDNGAPTPGTPQCDGSPCGGAGVWYDNSQDVTLSATDSTPGTPSVYYTTDGSTPTTSSSTAQPIAVSSATTIRWIAVDAVGNATAVQTIQVNVDTSAPGAPSLAFSGLTNATVDGTTVYVRTGASAAFTVTATATDAGSGIKHATFPGLTGWTPSTSTNDTSSPYSQAYTAASATAPGGTHNVTATNLADLTSTGAGFTLSGDGTPPSLTVQCNSAACAGPYNSAVTVSASATDATPGGVVIRYTTDGSTPTTSSTLYTGPFSVSSSQTVKVRAWDAVGNTSDATATVNVDTTAPAYSSSSKTGGNTITVTFTENLSSSIDLATAFQVEVGSEVAPRATSAATLTSPNVVTITYGGAPVTAAGTQIRFRYLRPPGDLADAAGNAVAAIPFTAVGGTGAAPGPTSAPGAAEISSAPSSPTRSTGATFSFGAGGATSFECALDGSAFVACGSPRNLSGLGHGTHTFSVRGVNAVGPGPATSHTWTVDIQGPSLTKVDGPPTSTVDTGETFTWTSSEDATFLCRLDGGPASGCLSPKSIENVPPGDHVFEIWGVDRLGNAGPGISWSFRVIPPAAGQRDATPVKGEPTQPDQGGSVSTPDGSATLAWGADATPDDGLLMTISEPIGVPVTVGDSMNLAALVDASAYRLSTGDPVSEFGGAVIALTIDAAEAPLVVYTSRDGGATWELIPFVTGPGLDAGLRHGAYRQPGKIVILTRHLSLFALVGDTQAPSTPVLAGDVRAEGLRLSWQPSRDNSGQVARYVLLIDGAPAQAFGAATSETIVSGFGPDDRRSFQILAEDHAGNRSAPSAALRSVPGLTGMTLDEARAALEARGLILGSTTIQDSQQPAGTVIGQAPGSPGVAAAGSSVEIVLSRGQAPSARLVMRVATATTLPLAKRRTITVRLQVTKRANVVAILRSPQGEAVATWKRRVRAGVTILKFRVPSAVRRTGTYTLAIWAAGIGDRQRVVKRMKIRIVGQGAAAIGPAVNPPRTRVEVVLAGGSSQTRRLLNLQSSFRVQAISELSDAFDRASAGTVRARVIVIVDVSSDGVEVVRQFRQVLPDVHVVAVAAPSQAAAARAAGAAATVGPAASERELHRAIASLLVSA